MSISAKETMADIKYGHCVVGRVVQQLTPLSFSALKGILIRAPGSADPVPNTDTIWIGGLEVTADSTATGGIPIPPGSNIVLPLDDPSKLYVISTADNQDCAWCCL